MSVLILKNISKNIKQSKFYTVMADEVTNISSHEQLVIDQNFEPQKDMTGFYKVADIKSETLFTNIKDALSRMNINQWIVKANAMMEHLT